VATWTYANEVFAKEALVIGTRLRRLTTLVSLFTIGAAGALLTSWILNPPRDQAGPAAWSGMEVAALIFLGGGLGSVTALGVFAWQDRRGSHRDPAT
jgi:hypothetical protein